MNKKLKYYMLLISLSGYALFTVSRLFRASFSDFMLGFLEGMSFVFILAWGVFMCVCLVLRQNPYKVE